MIASSSQCIVETEPCIDLLVLFCYPEDADKSVVGCPLSFYRYNVNSQVLYIEASLLVDQYCRRGCFQKQTWKWVSMVSLGVFLSPEIPPPICPFSQPFQVIRFLPSPGFSPSSLKDRIRLHGLKIVELAENILKFLDQVGKKNI